MEDAKLSPDFMTSFAQILSSKVRGYYAILDRDDEALARAQVSPAGAGATVLQVRIKPGTSREILAVARMARAVTREFGAWLVVNDRVDLAVLAEADAVHLGQDDLPVADARALLDRLSPGRRIALGVSTHNPAQVRAAIDQGADYIGFGPVFATQTKEAPDPTVGLSALAEAVRLAGDTPVVAIGGITAERATEIRAAGAAAACAISAVNDSGNPAQVGGVIGRAWTIQAK